MLLTASFAIVASFSSAPVIGGSPVDRGEYPDVVAVLTADGSLCTGTLITTDVVLTAGHCIDGQPREVLFDSVDYSVPGPSRRVKWSRAYPDWEHEYDIGIVMLENPIHAKPRAVALDCPLEVGTPVRLVGFGLTTRDGSDVNTQLHQAMLKVLDPRCTRDRSCREQVSPDGELVAAGRGTDSCYGDSGGPLYTETPTGLALLGVVSRGLADSPTPCGGGGVYVRADQVVAWIEKQTGRKLERASCDVPADAPAAAEAAGCSTTGGTGPLAFGVPALFVLLALTARRRR